MEAHIIINKIEFLPENIQQQIVDYIDFLTAKYLKILDKDAEDETDFVLTNDIKAMLDQSIAHHEKNLHKAKPAKEVLNNIAKKYNYEL